MKVVNSEYHLTFYPNNAYDGYLLGRVEAACPSYQKELTLEGKSLISITFVTTALLKAAGG